MKFVKQNDPRSKPRTFRDVETNSFFINDEGYLCQKLDYATYNSIARGDGSLWADRYAQVAANEPVQRILADIVAIEFP